MPTEKLTANEEIFLDAFKHVLAGHEIEMARETYDEAKLTQRQILRMREKFLGRGMKDMERISTRVEDKVVVIHKRVTYTDLAQELQEAL